MIKDLKKRYPQWFFTIGWSSIVLVTFDGEIEKLDVTALDKQVDFPHWLAMNAVQNVEKLTESSYKLMKLAYRDVFIAFLDFET